MTKEAVAAVGQQPQLQVAADALWLEECRIRGCVFSGALAQHRVATWRMTKVSCCQGEERPGKKPAKNNRLLDQDYICSR